MPRIGSRFYKPIALGVLLLSVPSALSAQGGISLEAEVREGASAFDAGDFDRVVRIYTDVVARGAAGPQMEPVRYLLAQALVRVQKHAQAADVLTAYVKDYPTSPRIGAARLLLGASLAESGRVDEALGALRELDQDPNLRVEARRKQIAVLRKAGRQAEADRLQRGLLPARNQTFSRAEAVAAQRLLSQQLNEGSALDLDLARETLLALWRSGAAVDNLAALNTASLILGSRFLDEGRAAEAVTLLQNTRSRAEVLAAQTRRIEELEKLHGAQAAAGARSALGADAENTELANRLAEAKGARAALEDAADYDVQVKLRLGFAYLRLERPWEAILVFQTGLAAVPPPPDELAQNLHFGLMHARKLARRPAETLRLGEEFLTRWPSAPQALDVALLAGGTALETLDFTAAIRIFEEAAKLAPADDTEKARAVLLQLGNAYFAASNWALAAEKYDAFAARFASGQWREEALYRGALADLFGGQDLERSRKRVEAFLAAHPESQFEPDARYRLAVIAYALADYPGALRLTQEWADRFGAHPQLGDVLALRGDVLRVEGRDAEAVAAYREASRQAGHQEVLRHSLDQAAQLLEKARDWEGLARLFQATLDENPGHPLSLAWMNWLAKARTRLGEPGEAARALAALVVPDVADPAEEQVERALSLLAQIMARASWERPRTGPATDAAPPAWLAELFPAEAPPLVKAREMYYRAELERARRRPAEADRALLGLGRAFRPSELSAPLLALAGEAVLGAEDGDPAVARDLFRGLLERYPLSQYRDIALVGLGELALRAGEAREALGFVDDAIARAGAPHRLKEATLLQARARLELGDLDLAEQLFTQIASAKEWRGAATAQSLFHLGQIWERRGDLAKAHNHYQRVYLSHGRHAEWATSAYLAGAETLVKLGKADEAAATLRELLRNERLAARPEAAAARARLAQIDPS